MNLANKLSIFRILLVPFFVGCLVYYSPEKDYLRFVALSIFCLAVATDSIDGYLARVRGEKTRLGTFLDPLADKLLILSAFIGFALIKSLPAGLKLPPWVLIVVISRDAIIVLGSMIIYIITGNIEILPSKLGKATTFFQMVTVISLLLLLPFSDIIWKVMVFFTVVSGMGYILRGSRLLNTSSAK